MKWILIYLVVETWGVGVTTYRSYDSMDACFYAREELKVSMTDSYTEHFPMGSQAVCVVQKEKEM